ncbi:MAG: MoxR family ATPase [Polyangiales bacterium]
MTAEIPREAIEKFQSDLAAVRAELARVIVGQGEIVDGVLTCLLAGGHCLLEGVPGLGKTLLVRTLGQALDLSFSRIQFTPDLIPVDILGAQILVDDGKGGKSIEFQRGPIFANIVLADEINRATPKTQSALLEAMQEQSVTIARTSHTLAAPFFVLATQNPLEMEGTYPLPEAQLDRFFYKLQVGFPDREAMHAILDRTTGNEVVAVKAVLQRARILALRELVRQVPVARSVQDLAIRAVMGTHPDSAEATPKVKRFVRFGASPRGAQAVLLGAKIRAVMQGRIAASGDDVRACALPALRHRMILNFEGEAEGVRADDVLDEVLGSLKSKD